MKFLEILTRVSGTFKANLLSVCLPLVSTCRHQFGQHGRPRRILHHCRDPAKRGTTTGDTSYDTFKDTNNVKILIIALKAEKKLDVLILEVQ